MITIDDLKQIVMLGYLTDEMLEKLVPITDLLLFDENEFIFRQGDKSDRLYMLKEGKVLLELEVSDNITVFVSAIKQGHTFGWSAMLDEAAYTVSALCSEQCQVLSFRAEKLKALLEHDHTMGYILSQRLLVILKKRYDIRTEQFIKTITHHPDIADLL
ncbi:MAG: cyclic nucleotide-binding domain-containing protein [Desulfobacteraceae bacterium]|jgi:CRP-like cAMP-binding protein